MFIFNLKVGIKKIIGFDISENPFKTGKPFFPQTFQQNMTTWFVWSLCMYHHKKTKTILHDMCNSKRQRHFFKLSFPLKSSQSIHLNMFERSSILVYYVHVSVTKSHYFNFTKSRYPLLQSVPKQDTFKK